MRYYPLDVLPAGNGRHEVLCTGLVPHGFYVTAGDPERLSTEIVRLLISAAVCQAYEASAR